MDKEKAMKKAQEKLVNYDVYLSDSSLLMPLECKQKPKIVILCPNEQAMGDIEEILQALTLLKPPCSTCGGSGIAREQHDGGTAELFCDCPSGERELEAFLKKNPDCRPPCQPSAGEYDWRSEFQYLLDRKMLSRDELAYLFSQIKSIIDREFAAQAQTIAEQGIRLDTVNRIGKEACEELDQLQNENTEQAEEIRQMKDGLISVRKSTEIMEARRFADQALKGE